MKRWLLAFLLSFLSLSCQRANLRQDVSENCKLLKLVLTNPDTTYYGLPSGRYTLVKGRTNLEIDPAPEEVKRDIKRKIVRFFLQPILRFGLKRELQIPGYNVGPLVDVLFDINRKGVPLEIESDTAAGYFIDKENIFWGPGWNQFCKEHPKIWSITTVSIPAYDKQAGIMLVYKGKHLAPLAASGWVIVYRLSEGKLVELKRAMIWIS